MLTSGPKSITPISVFRCTGVLNVANSQTERRWQIEQDFLLIPLADRDATRCLIQICRSIIRRENWSPAISSTDAASQ
jgi:hypothetical protein